MVLTLLITYFKGAPFYNAISSVLSRQHRLEPINDVFGRLSRIGPQRLYDFQLIRSFNNSSTEFGWNAWCLKSQ